MGIHVFVIGSSTLSFWFSWSYECLTVVCDNVSIYNTSEG